MVRTVCGITLWVLWVVLAGWLALSLLGGFVGLALIMGAPTNATQPWTWIWTQFLQCCTLPCILLLTPVFNDRDSIVRAAMVLQGGQ